MEQPKACGVQQIDDLAAKCKTMADATLGVAAVTETLSTGDTDALAEQAADLTKRLQGIGNDLAEATRMMGGAGEALGSIKNPMKIKSATKALNYSKEVIALVTPETAYQGKVVAAMGQRSIAPHPAGEEPSGSFPDCRIPKRTPTRGSESFLYV